MHSYGTFTQTWSVPLDNKIRHEHHLADHLALMRVETFRTAIEFARHFKLHNGIIEYGDEETANAKMRDILMGMGFSYSEANEIDYHSEDLVG